MNSRASMKVSTQPVSSRRRPGPITTDVRQGAKLEPPACRNHKHLWLWAPAFAGATNYFFAAARSTKVLPPFILWASGASLIWITTASASTPRFFTSACVISRIMPAFCSSVRPAAMLTVISGISSLPFLFWPDKSAKRVFPSTTRPSTIFSIKQDVDARDKPGHDVRNEWLTPLHVMPRQHFAHFGDDLVLPA